MSIIVKKIWTEYKPDGEGGFKQADMVAYAPIGEANRSVTIERYDRLAKVAEPEAHGDNEAVKAAWQRFQVIKPVYEAWKKGHEAPVDGTPLGAWPGCPSELAEVLKSMGVRTVEEVAAMGDGIMSKVPYPGIRGMKEQAKLFLAAADQTKVSTQMAQKDQEIADLKAQMAELAEMVKSGSAASESQEKGDTERLREHAESLGIKVDKRWSDETLIAEIEKAEAASKAAA